jgi:hypothetical protein
MGNKKFNYLCALSDSILIASIDLLFKQYGMDDNIRLHNEIKQTNNYKLYRHLYNTSRHKLQYRVENDIYYNYPTFKISLSDKNSIEGRIHTTIFQWPDDIQSLELFESYYKICVGLNRKNIIDKILI